MEIKIDVNVNVNFTPFRVENIGWPASAMRKQETRPAQKPQKPQPQPEPQPEPQSQTEPANEPQTEPQPQTEAANEPQTEPQPQTEAANEPAKVITQEEARAERKPEDMLPFLRARFGIPDLKEDRNEEQQQMAKALTKCVRELIREVTHNGAAKSIADLRDPAAVNEFIDSAARISYRANDGTFTVMPF